MDPNWWAIIIGFVGGAIITVTATLLIVRWQRQRKELSYRIEIHPFLAPEVPGKPGVHWDPNVKVLYRNREVSQLFPFTVTLRNTGNQTLEKIPIVLEPTGEAEILSTIVGLPRETEVGDIQHTIEKPERSEIQIGFLNEGDKIEVYGIGTSDDQFQLMVKVPQPGVKVRNRPEFWTSREAWLNAARIAVQSLALPYR